MGTQKKATPEAYQINISDNALKNIDETPVTSLSLIMSHSMQLK